MATIAFRRSSNGWPPTVLSRSSDSYLPTFPGPLIATHWPFQVLQRKFTHSPFCHPLTFPSPLRVTYHPFQVLWWPPTSLPKSSEGHQPPLPGTATVTYHVALLAQLWTLQICLIIDDCAPSSVTMFSHSLPVFSKVKGLKHSLVFFLCHSDHSKSKEPRVLDIKLRIILAVFLMTRYNSIELRMSKCCLLEFLRHFNRSYYYFTHVLVLPSELWLQLQGCPLQSAYQRSNVYYGTDASNWALLTVSTKTPRNM